ncbi:PhnE/PtxC family ABC transporter permease, partial [Sporosarcina sp. NCCP-2222]|uniref:PhnE/PtxC family ABC transporter permease n=1 Tax=Sporosarcina sp. NCCP-2222 TaxID=2935073 RepID=UPI0035CF9511
MDKYENYLYAYERKTPYAIMIGFIFLLLIGWSFTTVQLQNVEKSGWTIASNILSGLLQPDLGLLFTFTKQGVPYLFVETIAIAFLGTILGALLAIPLSFLSASNVVPQPVAWVTRLFLIFIRTVPALVYGLMFI